MSIKEYFDQQEITNIVTYMELSLTGTSNIDWFLFSMLNFYSQC